MLSQAKLPRTAYSGRQRSNKIDDLRFNILVVLLGGECTSRWEQYRTSRFRLLLLLLPLGRISCLRPVRGVVDVAEPE